MMSREQKYIDYFFRWIRLGQSEIGIAGLLTQRNITKLAIYGMDKLAECMMYELKDNTDIELKFIIDRNPEVKRNITFPIIRLDEVKEWDIDAIIIDPVAEFEEIKRDISKYTDVRLVTFEELIYEL